MAEKKQNKRETANPSAASGKDLRRRAEEQIKQHTPDLVAIAPEEAGRLLHELRVHQVELEMQNENLRRAQQELEASRDRYFDLYNLAPVGYLTLSEQGLILEANLTMAQMLGQERSRLTGNPLSHFISPETMDKYYFFLKRLEKELSSRTLELKMKGKKDVAFWAHLENKAAQDSQGRPAWKVTLTDITKLKIAEEALHLINEELETRVLERTAALEKEIAERKEIEGRLRESEKQLRFLSKEILNTQEKERKRIAGELHDSIAASLSALKLSIEATFDQLKPDEINQAKEKIFVSRVQDIIQETRRIMVDLRPSVLDDLGIVPAIHWFCREFQNTHSGMVIEQQIDFEENKIPDALRTPIFRIVQEAFNNIAKHSRATSVTLSLGKSPQGIEQGIELVIHDNGQGFDLEKKTKTDDPRRGLGLTSMRERAELSGGSFLLKSGKNGTTIRVSWPPSRPHNEP